MGGRFERPLCAIASAGRAHVAASGTPGLARLAISDESSLVLAPRRYLRQREALLSALLLLHACLLRSAGAGALLRLLPAGLLARLPWLLRCTGAESLAVFTIGFKVRWLTGCLLWLGRLCTPQACALLTTAPSAKLLALAVQSPLTPSLHRHHPSCPGSPCRRCASAASCPSTSCAWPWF